jgi:hypothetical protein
MANAVTKIEEIASTSSSFTFTSIPATYDDLMIIGSAKNNHTSSSNLPPNSWYMRFNGDTTSDYAFRWYGSYDSSAYGPLQTSVTNIELPGVATSESSNAGWGHWWLHIPGYKASSQKSGLFAGGWSQSSSAPSGSFRGSFNWNKTGAITSILFGPQYGSFVTGTNATLYGISNA